jgi:hypothetical protein
MYKINFLEFYIKRIAWLVIMCFTIFVISSNDVSAIFSAKD